MSDASPDVRALFDAAALQPMMSIERRQSGPQLARMDIEALIPHRDPLLLVDRVTHVDRDAVAIVCRYTLDPAADLVRGHFPQQPVWPGVLQVEAIGQAGLCLSRLLAGENAGEASGFALTHILGARFVRPVTPTGDLEIVSRVLTDGLFTIVVGQCLQQNAVCSVAAMRGLFKETGE
jgi:3-hydroxyacyl-[acyl-carrier-protein] dehydratase